MPTTEDDHDAPPGALALFLTGLGFAPVGVVPLPAYTAFAWFLLQTSPAMDADPVRAFLTTDSTAAR
jgi:hypothetical protein